jgi:hypothetical protein
MNQWSNLLHYRVSLVPLIVTNADPGSGRVFYRLISLLDGQNIRLQKIDAINCVAVINDLFARSVYLAIYYYAVSDAATRKQKTPPGVWIKLFPAQYFVDYSHY